MKKIIAFFTNKIVISIIGLIALSIVVWLAGPLFKFGDNNTVPLASEMSRLITIMVLILLWGLNNLRIQMTGKKQNAELVGDLEQNQEAESADMAMNQSSEESEQISQRFTDALSTLSKLKFKGKSSNKALYELPWYIIIGPPGSGKTTALVNSSLDFPLADQFGKGALQGVGGTRNCDWWFTNEAVLIDTAGRYTTQDSHKVVDSNAWESFLSLLKKNRRRRPINGAIVAISLQDLLLQSEQERQQHAKIIRTRIDELMQKLEIRFPVYLMFTKSDLVSGFSEYFEDLSKEEREQVWGISLPDAPNDSQSPDFGFLQQELQQLLDRLYSRELARVHQERDVKRRGLIQGFPQQMENLKSVIESFVNQTFIKNRFQYQPYLRGVYFTSGTQDGSPIDRMMTAVSSNFGFEREAVPLQQGMGKSFFLGNLFRNVIFTESELVGSNRKYERFIKWSQRSAYVGLALAGLGLLAVWATSINRHDEFMLDVDRYVTEFEVENKRVSDWNKDVRVVVPALNALARASIVYDQNEHPWLSGLGLYDGNVDSSADAAYQAQLKTLLLPRVVYYLEKRIALGHQGGDLYHNFRTYLMFNKRQYLDKSLIVEWFKKDWKANMQGEASQRQALITHLTNLLNLELAPYELNNKLVKQTRSLLLRVPVHQRIYSRIKNRAEYSQKVDMLNLFGESVRETFDINEKAQDALQLPFMFTKEGYDSVDLSTSSPVIADIVKERWVLTDDDKDKVDFVTEDLDDISEKVEGLYMADYVSHWNRVLESLDVNDFTSIRQSTEVLTRFTDPVYSPLLAILQVTTENTQLTPPLMQNMKDDHSEGKTGKVTSALAEQFKGTKVDQAFRPLHQLVRESSKRPAPISLVVQNIQTLNDFITEVSIAPEPSKKSFQVAKARYQSGSGNAITSLNSYAKNMPKPVKRWLKKLSDQSWKVILSSAHQHINTEWKNQVYNVYRQGLAGRYPLKTSSKNELALLDFSDFFKPQGTLDKFHTGFVKPFVNTRKGWVNKTVDGRSLGLKSTTLKQMRRAQNIKNIFFRKNPESPSISFQLKPYRMEKDDARFWLDVGSQRISYNHGPKFWKELNWSAEDENNRVRLVFEDLQENHHEKSFDGPWAWFKLQDQARLTKTKKSNVYLVKYSVQDRQNKSKKRTIQYLIKAKSVNNPFSQNLLGAFKCPDSI